MYTYCAPVGPRSSSLDLADTSPHGPQSTVGVYSATTLSVDMDKLKLSSSVINSIRIAAEMLFHVPFCVPL